MQFRMKQMYTSENIKLLQVPKTSYDNLKPTMLEF